jgi:hypothetical protein
VGPTRQHRRRRQPPSDKLARGRRDLLKFIHAISFRFLLPLVAIKKTPPSRTPSLPRTLAHRRQAARSRSYCAATGKRELHRSAVSLGTLLISDLHPFFPLALAHLPDTFLFSIVLQSVERIHDRILLSPDANSSERLLKPRDALVTHTLPPEPLRPLEPARKNAVSQILSYAPISPALCAMPMRH